MSRNILIVSFVLVLTASVFIRTVNHAFIIWDDDKNVYENPFISQYGLDGLDGIKRYWNAPFIGLYIPVTYTVWSLIAYDAGTKVSYGSGPDPVIDATRFHLANVILHTASVALVILLFYQLLGRKDVFAAAVGASLFALHPLQVEPVAWATGLKDVLSGFLALICIILYVSYSRLHRRGKPGWAWSLYAAALLLYIVALLAKPQLVVIPPIIAILLWSLEPFGLIPGALPHADPQKRTQRWDHWDDLLLLGILGLVCLRVVLVWGGPGIDPILPDFRPAIDVPLIALAVLLGVGLWLRWPVKKIRAPSFFGDVVWLTPFLVAAFTFVVITVGSQPDQDAIFKFDRPPLHLRFFVALDALGFYISKLIYPFGLCVDYGRTPAKALEFSLGFPIWILPIAAGLLLLPLRLSPYRRKYLAAVAVAFVAIGPVLGLIPFAFQGQSTVADRYVYLAMIGLGFGFATFLTFTGSALPRYAAVCLLPVMAWISFIQVGKWKNSEVLFQNAIAVNPGSVASAYNLGLTYSKEQQYEKSLEYYHRTINLKDDFSHPWNNIGFILNTLRRYREAMPYLEKAIEINPEFPGSYSNIGISHDHVGEYDKALEYYNKALEVQPINAAVFLNIGLAHMGKGNPEKALPYFTRASSLEPNLFQPYSGLGDASMKLKNYPAAIQAYHSLVQLKPDNPRYWRALAHPYAFNGQFEQAVRHMEHAVEMIRNTPGAGPEVIHLFERDLENFRAGRTENPEKPPPPSETEMPENADSPEESRDPEKDPSR